MTAMKTPVYLDYAASTPVDPAVAEVMAGCLTLDGNFANPASRSHIYGWRAESAVEDARQQLAELINADLREIVWTSGATESNNLALKGVAQFYAGRGRHIITSAIEHKSVLDSCAWLESSGFAIDYLAPQADGRIDPAAVKAALREDTILVSLMHINNELGSITDIAAIAALLQDHPAFFHVDAAQSAGKLVLDMQAVPVDLLSLSAHKMYGPKGIGALYVNRSRGVQLAAQMHGGGHERGLRSGTLATHQIAGFGQAAELARRQLADESHRIARLRDQLWQGIADLPGVACNVPLAVCGPCHLNVHFAGVDGETLLMALREIAVSTGSACASASMAPSYVLKGIGLDDQAADSSIRLSVGRFTSDDDIHRAVQHIRSVLPRLQQAAGAAGSAL
ncbi:MAG TPA: aminotransferase class V-fold PLP-dependent enzyme [Pseudomonadales bacterium]